MLQPPSNFLNTERSTHMFLRQTVPNDFPKPKSNKIKTKAFDLGLLPVCSRGEGWLFLLSLSLKRSKWMFTPSPLTDTEVRSCPCGGVALQKTFSLVRVLVNLSYSMYQKRGKAFASPFMLVTHSDILYSGGGEREEPQKLKTTPLKLADVQNHNNSILCSNQNVYCNGSFLPLIKTSK